MIKKQTASLILCLLIVILLPVQAMAENTDNTNKKCSLAISFLIGSLKPEGVEFKLYRVADITSSDNFSVTQRFEAYPVSHEDFDASDRWRNLAQTLSGYVTSDNLQPDSTAKTTAQGTVYFNELPTGLYLVIGSQYISEEKIYTPQSFMISVPTKNAYGNWQYDLTVDVKYDSDSSNDTFDIEILKIWNDGSNSNRPDEVTVELYKDNHLYAAALLNKSDNWRYSFNDLNKDSVWVVKEKDVQAGYTVSVERQNNNFVLTNTKTDISNDSTPTDHTLPQTGLLWWPVPYLLAGGLLIIIIGVLCRRGAADEK